MSLQCLRREHTENFKVTQPRRWNINFCLKPLWLIYKAKATIKTKANNNQAVLLSMKQQRLWSNICLKQHMLDICRHISAADGDTQMQFVNNSEVKFVCLRIPCFRTWVRHWSLCRKKYGYLIGPYRTFNHHRTANPYANPYADASGSTKIACGDWLVCQTTSVCNNPKLRARLEFWLVHFLRTYPPM